MDLQGPSVLVTGEAGDIVITAAIAAMEGQTGQLAYATAKAASGSTERCGSDPK